MAIDTLNSIRAAGRSVFPVSMKSKWIDSGITSLAAADTTILLNPATIPDARIIVIDARYATTMLIRGVLDKTAGAITAYPEFLVWGWTDLGGGIVADARSILVPPFGIGGSPISMTYGHAAVPLGDVALIAKEHTVSNTIYTTCNPKVSSVDLQGCNRAAIAIARQQTGGTPASSRVEFKLV